MTLKQTSEIFAAMLLAWPSAEIFKGGLEKLEPTIQLWATCLADVDWWTAQRAVIKLCQENRYPPTIADFREKASTVRAEVQAKVNVAAREAELGTRELSPETYYRQLPDTSLTRAAIDLMGGPEKLNTVCMLGDRQAPIWNHRGFREAYERVLRQAQKGQKLLSGGSGTDATTL